MAAMYYIIYPGGDKTKLSVLEYDTVNDYDLDDYARVSRHEFMSRDAAVRYGKRLAEEHGLSFVSNSPEDDYLD